MRVFIVAATAALAAATPATLFAQEGVPDETEISDDALSTLSESWRIRPNRNGSQP